MHVTALLSLNSKSGRIQTVSDMEKMVLNNCRILILLTALMTALSCGYQVKVIVRNTGEASDMLLRHTIPVGRMNPGILRDTLSGTKEIRFRIDTRYPVFISLQDVRELGNIIYFPVKGGKTYHLSYDGEAFVFDGPGQDAQRLYANLPLYPHPQMEAMSYARETDVERIHHRVDSTRRSQMAPFDSLRAAHKIPGDLYDLIAADRECNSLVVMGQVGVLRREDGITDSVFDGIVLDSDRLSRSPMFYDLIEMYSNRQLGKRIDEVMPLIMAGQLNTLRLDEYKKVLTGDRFESEYAFAWYYAAIQKNFEKELIPLFEGFEASFPDSPYLREMRPFYHRIRAYHAPKEMDLAIHFMENTDGISSFDELIARFVGEKVFVDVWATCCGPCKEEFAYKDPLHQILKEKGYTMLYLSLDEEKNDGKWREMVSFYGLNGEHIRASEALLQDLRKLFDQNGTLAVPWYLIIDEKGNIVNLHAPRPSEMDKLAAALDD